jgi:hypothetical protein
MSFDPQQDIYSLRNETGFLSPRQSAYVQRKRAELVNPQIELNLKLQANDRAQRAADLAYEQGMFEMDMKKKAFADAEVANKNLNELIAKIPSITEDSSLSPLDQSIALNDAFLKAGPSVARSPYFQTVYQASKGSLEARIQKANREQADRDRQKAEEIRLEGLRRQDLRDRRGEAMQAVQYVQDPELLEEVNALAQNPNATSGDWISLTARANVLRSEYSRQQEEKKTQALSDYRTYQQQQQAREDAIDAADGTAKVLNSSLENLLDTYESLAIGTEEHAQRLATAQAAARDSDNVNIAMEKAKRNVERQMAEERNSLLENWVENNVLPDETKAVIKGKSFRERLQNIRAQIESARRSVRKNTPAPTTSPLQQKTDNLFE